MVRVPPTSVLNHLLKSIIVLGASHSIITRERYTDPVNSFHVGNPEGIHELMHLFSDRGTPASLRHMNAYSGHTYKFTKEASI